MSQMVYKAGGNEVIWGIKCSYKIINDDEVEQHLSDGWVDHPHKMLNPAEPEPEKKSTRKKKADNDESNNEV